MPQGVKLVDPPLSLRTTASEALPLGTRCRGLRRSRRSPPGYALLRLATVIRITSREACARPPKNSCSGTKLWEPSCRLSRVARL